MCANFWRILAAATPALQNPTTTRSADRPVLCKLDDGRGLVPATLESLYIVQYIRYLVDNIRRKESHRR